MPGWLAFSPGIALPLFFWLCLWQGWPFWLGGLLLLPLAWPRRGKSGTVAVPSWLGLCAALLGVLALALRDGISLQYYPVVVNLAFLFIFAASLAQEQTVVERLARRFEPDLPPAGVRYTRKVTQAWCLFFVANGAVAWWSIGQGERVWALYNGLIAYLLMGLMFGGEWLLRRHFRHHSRRQG